MRAHKRAVLSAEPPPPYTNTALFSQLGSSFLFHFGRVNSFSFSSLVLVEDCVPSISCMWYLLVVSALETSRFVHLHHPGWRLQEVILPCQCVFRTQPDLLTHIPAFLTECRLNIKCVCTGKAICYNWVHQVKAELTGQLSEKNPLGMIAYHVGPKSILLWKKNKQLDQICVSVNLQKKLVRWLQFLVVALFPWPSPFQQLECTIKYHQITSYKIRVLIFAKLSLHRSLHCKGCKCGAEGNSSLFSLKKVFPRSRREFLCAELINNTQNITLL